MDMRIWFGLYQSFETMGSVGRVSVSAVWVVLPRRWGPGQGHGVVLCMWVL